VIRSPKRDALRAHLDAHGVETGLHYPVPLHRQPCFADVVMDRESFPVSDNYGKECLTLPLFVGMTDVQVELVIAKVREFMKCT
jgi:dTDP-4-amino-4,6-dideoxygalactose transaminase